MIGPGRSDEKVRVGVNTLFLLPEAVGGSEPYTRRLLAELALREDLALTVFTNRENHETFSGYERVPIAVRAVSRPLRIAAEQIALPRALRRHGIDVLFSPGYTAPLRSPVPSVTAVFDVQFQAVPQGFSPLSRALHAWLVGGAARRAETVVTLSAFGKAEVASRLGVAPERIAVTPPGPGVDSTSPYPRPHTHPYILAIANSYPHKNLQRLGRAFAAIVNEIPQDLVVIGQARGGEPPAHPRIRRINRCNDDEVAGFLQHCDAFVFPSRYEGFGLPVLEALNAGARVVASDIPPVREIAADAALYFDPHDEAAMARAILTALREPEEARKAARETGMRRGAAFTWRRCADETAGVLRRAAGRV